MLPVEEEEVKEEKKETKDIKVQRKPISKTVKRGKKE